MACHLNVWQNSDIYFELQTAEYLDVDSSHAFSYCLDYEISCHKYCIEMVSRQSELSHEISKLLNS